MHESTYAQVKIEQFTEAGTNSQDNFSDVVLLSEYRYLSRFIDKR